MDSVSLIIFIYLDLNSSADNSIIVRLRNSFKLYDNCLCASNSNHISSRYEESLRATDYLSVAQLYLKDNPFKYILVSCLSQVTNCSYT